MVNHSAVPYTVRREINPLEVIWDRGGGRIYIVHLIGGQMKEITETFYRGINRDNSRGVYFAE